MNQANPYRDEEGDVYDRALFLQKENEELRQENDRLKRDHRMLEVIAEEAMRAARAKAGAQIVLVKVEREEDGGLAVVERDLRRIKSELARSMANTRRALVVVTWIFILSCWPWIVSQWL